MMNLDSETVAAPLAHAACFMLARGGCARHSTSHAAGDSCGVPTVRTGDCQGSFTVVSAMKRREGEP
jgi:hypothetical protein